VAGERPLGILQIPFTMAGIRAPYDPNDPSARPPKRYLDLSFAPDRLRRGLSTVLLKHLEYLVLVVHPLQASGRDIPEGGLVVGGVDTLRANLRTILDAVEQTGRPPRFLTIAAFRRFWLGEEEETEEGALPASKGTREGPREPRERRTKGGVRRTRVEGGKAVRRGESAGRKITGESRPRRRGPRKRRG
jgi:hypothetical protein